MMLSYPETGCRECRPDACLSGTASNDAPSCNFLPPLNLSAWVDQTCSTQRVQGWKLCAKLNTVAQLVYWWPCSAAVSSMCAAKIQDPTLGCSCWATCWPRLCVCCYLPRALTRPTLRQLPQPVGGKRSWSFLRCTTTALQRREGPSAVPPAPLPRPAEPAGQSLPCAQSHLEESRGDIEVLS